MHFNIRRQQRIDRDVEDQATYVARRVCENLAAGEEPPIRTYAYVRGITPEDTVEQVGKKAIELLGESYLLNADLAERASELTRGGAFIEFIPLEES